MSRMQTFLAQGWTRFEKDRAVQAWVEAALPLARAAVTAPEMAHWHVCEGTWFVGVDALPNAADGAVAGSGPLTGAVMDFVAELGPVPPLHPAQVSVIYPGYPRPRAGEGEAAFGYRLRRDAAHVDGVRPEGAARRRFVLEPHSFILGLPLVPASERAAPLVVWEGSHEIMRAAFAAAFRDRPPEAWRTVDVTEIYQAARREVFENCTRVEVSAAPGEAYVVHRLALHGVAPWAEGEPAGPDGRMIAYFRPECPGGHAEWLQAP